MTFALMSTFAFADCYTDFLNAYNAAEQAYRDACWEVAINAEVSCIHSIEEALHNPFTTIITLPILIHEACDSEQELQDLACGFGESCDRIGTDFCICVGGTNC